MMVPSEINAHITRFLRKPTRGTCKSIYYTNKPRHSYLAKSTTVALIALTFLFLSFVWLTGSSNQNNASASIVEPNTSTTSKSVDNEIETSQTNEQGEELAIPACYSSQPIFGGNSSFRCETKSSNTIDYEYFENPEILDSINTTFGLTQDISHLNRAFRSGILENKTRLMATDKDLGLVVNIISKSDEDQLIQWWANYRPESSMTTQPPIASKSTSTSSSQY